MGAYHRGGLQRPVIEVGNLKPRRAFLHVTDTVRGFYLAAMKRNPGEAHNLCASRTYEIRDILHTAILLPPSVVHIGRSHVADGLVIAAVVVILDEVLHGAAQFVRAGVDQQVHARLQGFVEALDLAVGLRRQLHRQATMLRGEQITLHVRFRGGAATIVLAPAGEGVTAADVTALVEDLT